MIPPFSFSEFWLSGMDIVDTSTHEIFSKQAAGKCGVEARYSLIFSYYTGFIELIEIQNHV